MITDLRQNSTNQSISADICIVGGGAAGISLAMKLAPSGKSIVLLEGGGLELPTAEELDLYDAEIAEKHYPIASSRLRYFGGSTNHWGGWSRPLDPVDFLKKDYVPLSGWPIQPQELSGYYASAAEVCELSSYDNLVNGYFDNNLQDKLLDFSKGPFENKYFIFSPPTRFGRKYLPIIEQAENVNAFLHANATSLIMQKDKVNGVNATSLNGNKLTINADTTVLAQGGLEIPRFLLNNHNQDYPNGVGNTTDWVGRCFMDHAGFQPIQLYARRELSYKRFKYQEQSVMPVISMTDQALLEQKMNNFCIILSHKPYDQTLTPAYSKNPWLSEGGAKYAMGKYQAQYIFEPTPCTDSRVTLTDKKDNLGQNKLKLDWQFNSADFASVIQSTEMMAEELGSRGLGRIKHIKKFTPEHIKRINGGMHHAGTARMSVDPAEGVVDSNCKVHDTEGLYLIGNCVFPTVGFSNPTITIVALTHRLADHLEQLV